MVVINEHLWVNTGQVKIEGKTRKKNGDDKATHLENQKALTK
jgi:hypothetical protein